jgi:hypothetical protein
MFQINIFCCLITLDLVVDRVNEKLNLFSFDSTSKKYLIICLQRIDNIKL